MLLSNLGVGGILIFLCRLRRPCNCRTISSSPFCRRSKAWSLSYKSACHVSLPQLLWNCEVVFLWSSGKHAKQFELCLCATMASLGGSVWLVCVEPDVLSTHVPVLFWSFFFFFFLLITKCPRASALWSQGSWWRWGRGGQRRQSLLKVDIQLTWSLSVCLLRVRGDKREWRGRLCSQNNWSNGETGTEPQGSSRQWFEGIVQEWFCVLCGFFFWFFFFRPAHTASPAHMQSENPSSCGALFNPLHRSWTPEFASDISRKGWWCCVTARLFNFVCMCVCVCDYFYP